MKSQLEEAAKFVREELQNGFEFAITANADLQARLLNHLRSMMSQLRLMATEAKGPESLFDLLNDIDRNLAAAIMPDGALDDKRQCAKLGAAQGLIDGSMICVIQEARLLQVSRDSLLTLMGLRPVNGFQNPENQ